MRKETKMYSLRLPEELKNKLDKVSKKLGKPKSVIIREAVTAFLDDMQDFSTAINALEELKDGDYNKASKKIDKLVKDIHEEASQEDISSDDFDFAVKALEELKDGDYNKASKKINKIVKDYKKK
ncbi:ribbon-helix-helix protein, CopG family [Campylobacter sp. LR291e]|nr:ribbon-helix-helix protein, CopG family [Campylobacter sp. LR196d]KAA6225298.1 ribbon-helix-helix protein, CopG family [Campylobacter sp. LR286c]KAA6225583.1 ribbon-helix-helix protein, CopG family [Campylobacter sp. LR185c]KAA6230423.1 ribbon-helix-helix protein, CopG family [Campylobacter sp. LR291e]KAA6230551.1 ribbon-helix-helix protein, CopG family [Campylobacter sp. LR264d]